VDDPDGLSARGANEHNSVALEANVRAIRGLGVEPADGTLYKRRRGRVPASNLFP
jgi:hypothetical protein